MSKKPYPDSHYVGQKFNRLTIIATDVVRAVRKIGKRKIATYIRWVTCQCECGNVHRMRYANVQGGRSKSCGCLIKEAVSKRIATLTASGHIHRKTHTPVYAQWGNLRQDGTLCEEWRDFRKFYKHVGNRPYGKVLIRKDVNLPFGPDNCAGWANPIIAARQYKRAILLTVRGETKTCAEWASLAGVSRQAFEQWLHDEHSVKRGREPRIRTEDDIHRYVHFPRKEKGQHQPLESYPRGRPRKFPIGPKLPAGWHRKARWQKDLESFMAKAEPVQLLDEPTSK